MLSDGTYFAEIYPMANKADARQALKIFVMKIGFPEYLMVDGSKEQNSPGTELMKCCRRNEIFLKRTDTEIPNHNPAERIFREVQRR